MRRSFEILHGTNCHFCFLFQRTIWPIAVIKSWKRARSATAATTWTSAKSPAATHASWTTVGSRRAPRSADCAIPQRLAAKSTAVRPRGRAAPRTVLSWAMGAVSRVINAASPRSAPRRPFAAATERCVRRPGPSRISRRVTTAPRSARAGSVTRPFVCFSIWSSAFWRTIICRRIARARRPCVMSLANLKVIPFSGLYLPLIVILRRPNSLTFTPSFTNSLFNSFLNFFLIFFIINFKCFLSFNLNSYSTLSVSLWYPVSSHFFWNLNSFSFEVFFTFYPILFLTFLHLFYFLFHFKVKFKVAF